MLRNALLHTTLRSSAKLSTSRTIACLSRTTNAYSYPFIQTILSWNHLTHSLVSLENTDAFRKELATYFV